MSRQSSVRSLVSFGVKYAPLAYEGLKHGRGPAKAFAEKQVSRRTARTIAMEHAAHLVDGSVLPVYDGDQRVWVVFSGDTPVGTHPIVTTPIADLLTHYDLGKRLRADAGRGPLARRRRTGSNAGTSHSDETPEPGAQA